MKLDPADFESVGLSLSIGARVRAQHWCGDGDILLVSRKPDGISAHCFRCNASGFIRSELPLHERIAQLAKAREADALMQGQLDLPDGETDPAKWPTPARVWVYKAGLNNDELKRLGFRFNVRMQRVIMPVLDDAGMIVFWQGRSLDKGRPKYINPAADRSDIAYKSGRGRGDVLVLTEDILSAVKVGRQCEAWCIMGTSLSDRLALRIAGLGRKVIVALDPDPAGRRGAGKVLKTLALIGVPAQAAYMQRDPKFHSNLEIKQWLSSISWQH